MGMLNNENNENDKYDTIPETMEDNNYIIIYEDIKGKIETSQYLRANNAASLKDYLLSIGYKKVYYVKHLESFEVNRPFREDKPFIKKRSGKEIDWTNPEVVKVALMTDLTAENAIRELVILSGLVPIGDSLATGYGLEASYRKIDVAFRKWKREQNKAETKENREELVTEFSKIFCANKQNKSTKIVPIETKVFILSENLNGIIQAHNPTDNTYTILTSDGAIGYSYKRKEFEVLSA
jgi:hypothetical protein